MTDAGGFALTVGDSEVLLIPEGGPAERLNVLDHIPSRPNVLLAWLDGRTALEPHVHALDGAEHLLCLVTDGVRKVIDYAEIAGIVRESLLSGGMGDLLAAAREAGSADDLKAYRWSSQACDRSVRSIQQGDVEGVKCGRHGNRHVPSQRVAAAPSDHHP